MTVSSTISRKAADGDGSTTAFPFPYPFTANADLTVILIDSDGVETTQTLDTDYTVTGAGEASGGTVTMTTAPASGETLLIIRDPALTQDMDLVENSGLPAETTESVLDKLVMIAQRTRDLVTRSLHLSNGDEAVDLTLPIVSERASKYLAFDADGGPIASTGPTGDSSIPVSAFIETLLDDADAATARATLGAAATDVDSEFTANQTIVSDDSTNAIGPEFSLKRNSASPADSDNIGRYRFDGKNSDGDDTLYAAVAAQVQDVTADTEDAAVIVQTMQDGTLTNAGVFEKGFRAGSPAGGDPGAGKISAENGFEVDGRALAGGVRFKAHKNGTDQTGIASGTPTKLTFPTEVYDYGDAYDTTTSEWTPPAGPVEMTAAALYSGGVVDGSDFAAQIYKDGVLFARDLNRAKGTNSQATKVTVTDEADGTNVYTVRFTAGGTGDKTVEGDATDTWFEGKQI